MAPFCLYLPPSSNLEAHFFARKNNSAILSTVKKDPRILKSKEKKRERERIERHNKWQILAGF